MISLEDEDERDSKVVAPVPPPPTTTTISSSSSSIVWHRRFRRVCVVLFPLALVLIASFYHGVRVQQASLGAIKEGRSYEYNNSAMSLAEQQQHSSLLTNDNNTKNQSQQRHDSDDSEPQLQQQQQQQQQHQEENQKKSPPPNDNKHQNQNQQPQPLNIVLFYADDWTMNVMGKFNKYVSTPNIDNMADHGMTFTNNCVTTSVCWMSRATLMTGVYASRHLASLPNSPNIFVTHPWKDTLFPLLKTNNNNNNNKQGGGGGGGGGGGYYTGLVGKWHAPQTPKKYIEMAFDYSNFYYGKHYMKDRKNGQQLRHVTELNEEDAMDFLKTRPNNKPFCLMVSFFATHAEDNSLISYKPQRISMEQLYQNNNNNNNNINNVTIIPTPKTATEEHWKELPPFFDETNEGRKRWHNRFEPKCYQENIKNLYRMATEVDTAIGNIIQELKDQGVYNNTLLIFTTDNGNLHGEHGLAEKWFPFEESIRVPLVIQDPRMPISKRGTINDDWTLNVDLAPTILAAAGIEQSSFMQGRDIAELYLNNDIDNDGNTITDTNNTTSSRGAWRQDFFYEYNRGDPVTAVGHGKKIPASFALVTKEWKYVYWPQHDYEQLFHRSIDPYDEWDTLKKDMIKTTDGIYMKMKARYEHLKKWVQSGNQI